MTTPLMQSRQEILDRLFFGPEIAVQNRNVGDRSSALLGHELLNGGMPGSGGPGWKLTPGSITGLAIQF
jgi:hypothetical protein